MCAQCTCSVCTITPPDITKSDPTKHQCILQRMVHRNPENSFLLNLSSQNKSKKGPLHDITHVTGAPYAARTDVQRIKLATLHEISHIETNSL
jgi:hypothetical protein